MTIYLAFCLIALIVEDNIRLFYNTTCDTINDMIISKNDMGYVPQDGSYNGRISAS